MLDSQQLSDFINDFCGYGTYDAPWWFVGMEEGGGGSEEQIASRLQAWQKRGCLELEDVADYHREFDVTAFWEPKPRLQPTWQRLIRFLLTAKNTSQSLGEVTTDAIRAYQRDCWGRRNRETCLLELLPLPSPSMTNWLYGNVSRIPELADREAYREWAMPFRIEKLRNRIQLHRPMVVLFYGFGYLDHWRSIAGTPLNKLNLIDAYEGQTDATVFLAAKHPTGRGVTNEYWKQLGMYVVGLNKEI